MPENDNKNVPNAGVVFSRINTKEDFQNKEMFNYNIPVQQEPSCLNINMRPKETRHDLLGINMCDILRQQSGNAREQQQYNENTPFVKQNDTCYINSYIPSWNKYSASINLESDIRNIIRKNPRSCDENSIYIPSTNSVMYSKQIMQVDSVIDSGYYTIKKQESLNNTPMFFMEDTRQTRMGKN
jgi:hypothetical protein